MIASIYARQDGTIAHVVDSTFSITPDANTTRVIQFSIDSYPDEYQHIANNTKAAFWDGANLQIDSVVYLDAAWIAARQAELTQAANIEAAQSGLLDKVLLAETYAADIRTVYNLVLTFTENQVTQPTRFNDLLSAFTNAATAFRNRFITDCEQELGFNPTGTLSAAQQRNACLFARVWITPLVLLLMARKVL